MTTRSRSSGSISNNHLTDFRYATARFGGCGNALTTQAVAYTVDDPVGELRSMTDVVTKGFRKKSAKGEIIVSPMSSRVISFSEAMYSTRVAYYSKTLQCSGASQFRTLYDFPAFAPLAYITPKFQVVNKLWYPASALGQREIENAVFEASTRCQNERGRPPANIWETVAERKQAYALLAQYMTQCKEIAFKIGIAAQKGRLPIPNKILRMKGHLLQATAGAWLISRYGLLPLISDIRLLLKQLKESQSEEIRHTSRGKAIVGRALQSSSSISWDGEMTTTLTDVVTDEVTVRAMSLDEWKMDYLDHLGFGTKGLITLPWELVTLSFVADWFANIGDVIGALVPTPGLKQLGACIVTTRTQSLTSTVSGFVPVGSASVVSQGPVTKVGTLVEKTRVPGLRAPTLVLLNRSKIDPELDKNRLRIVDASALIAQRLGRASLNLSYANFNRHTS